MKKSSIQLFFLMVLFVCNACNDEWKEEQFEHYVSFKAPLESEGVANIYVRYKDGQKTTFLQPLEVSGSTTNDMNLSVRVGVDADTLGILNYERFQNRQDFYYKQLDNSYFSIPETVNIKTGENTALMAIDFSLKGIDMAEKWVLPLTILEDPAAQYKINPRKHYKKALLRVNPFNNYSGTYSGTALKVVMDGHESETPIVKSQIRSYVVDENTIFFYAGNIDEDRKDRKNYKIFATFSETGGVTFRAENPNMKFAVKKDASYTISEQMDAVRPYLLHRYITLNNVDYEFTDYTLVSTTAIKFKVSGSLILERQLNTQIPDEDQSIEW
ncbi:MULTISPECIES: DUF4973 domain-containing protein [unclassified Sphingobacterium]|uniref:DUF4973 domain-containing protein n=1 Tax=unclassified Sphingobacterium TaxID=2609468 RepID=UPI0025CCA366|nr:MULTISPECIES: DUF4973 domain-containing protein [unclassified Sphingobacterium]